MAEEKSDYTVNENPPKGQATGGVGGTAAGQAAAGGSGGDGYSDYTYVPVDYASRNYAILAEKQGEADRKQRAIFFYFYLAQLAASIYATVEAYRAYKKYLNAQESLLKFQRSQSEREYNRYATVFAPCEDEYMAEVCGLPMYVPRYEATAATMRQGAVRAFDIAKEVVLKTRTRYCAGYTGHQLKELAIARAMAESDAVSMAYRYEDAIQEDRNINRHNKFTSMFGIGRNIQTNAINGISNLTSAYGSLATGAQQGLNSGIQGIFSSAGSIISNRSGMSGGGSFFSPNQAVGNTGVNLPNAQGLNASSFFARDYQLSSYQASDGFGGFGFNTAPSQSASFNYAGG